MLVSAQRFGCVGGAITAVNASPCRSAKMPSNRGHLHTLRGWEFLQLKMPLPQLSVLGGDSSSRFLDGINHYFRLG